MDLDNDITITSAFLFPKEKTRSAFLFPKQKRNAGKEKCLVRRSKTADKMAKINFSKAESITRKHV